MATIERNVCRLGLGTIWFGRQWPPGNPSYCCPDDKEIDIFLRAGIQEISQTLKDELIMVDTATAYGNCEERLGSWLKKNSDLREKIFLATKWGGSYGREVSGEGKIYNMSIDQLQADYAASVRHLGKIDCLYYHLPGQVPFDEAMESLANKQIISFLKDLRTSGSVRWIGASISSAEVLQTALSGALLDWMDVLQIPARIAQTNTDLWAQLQASCNYIVLNSPVRHSKTDPKADNFKIVLWDFPEATTLTGTRHHLSECLVDFGTTGKDQHMTQQGSSSKRTQSA